MGLSQEEIKQIITEIKGEEEVARRARFKRRHDIYKDSGKGFLLEQIEREFSKEAVAEMRLAPVNLLKKMVNKRSSVYKSGAIRLVGNDSKSDQALVDFYSQKLALDEQMQKANRYFNLLANTALYVRPYAGCLKLDIVPGYLYSIRPNPMDRTQVMTWIFSAFAEEGRVTPTDDVPAATGVEGYSRNRGVRTVNDQVDSQEYMSEAEAERYIFWDDETHVTTDGKSNVVIMDPDKGEEQFINPIGMAPVVNLAKDRDNEPWAVQGEDAVDVCMAIMLGWTDLLTIAKHQGFSILTIVSSEEPKQLKIGVNKAVWLRAEDGKPTPSISYVTGSSPLAEYKELLMDLLALLLSSNGMPPNSIGGQNSNKTFTSGFHALIEMADILEAVEEDKPKLRKAEQDLWTVIKAWHNYMIDFGLMEDEEAKSLGKFSEDFSISVQFKDVKPIESEQDRVNLVKELKGMGLMTREDALKKLYPDLTDEQITEKIQKIDEELGKLITRLNAPAQPQEEEEQDGV